MVDLRYTNHSFAPAPRQRIWRSFAVLRAFRSLRSLSGSGSLRMTNCVRANADVKHHVRSYNPTFPLTSTSNAFISPSSVSWS